MALRWFIAPGESVRAPAWLEHCGDEPPWQLGLPQLWPLFQGCEREREGPFAAWSQTSAPIIQRGIPKRGLQEFSSPLVPGLEGVGENLQPIISTRAKGLTGNIFKQMSCVLTKFQ